MPVPPEAVAAFFGAMADTRTPATVRCSELAALAAADIAPLALDAAALRVRRPHRRHQTVHLARRTMRRGQASAPPNGSTASPGPRGDR